MMNVEPIVTPLVPEGRLALSYFVGVMRESVINSAAVDIKILAKMLSRNTGAFDMPTGIAYSKRRIPFKLLVVKL